MKIRNAKLSDLEDLTGLAVQLIESHYKFGKKTYRLGPKARKVYRIFFKKCIRSQNALVQVVEGQSGIVGYCLSLLEDRPPIYKQVRNCRVYDVFLLPEYRGRGLAKKLLKDAEAFAKRKRCGSMSVKASEKNKAATTLYKKGGFKISVKEMRKEL